MALVVNNSTNAVNKNVIIPEVYASLVDEKILGKVVIAQAADTDGVLQGQPGETVIFPSWQYIGDAADITVGQPIPTSKMKQSSRSATIKMIAPSGISVNDYDDSVSYGNALDKAAEMQATAIARKIDTDLIADAVSTPQKYQLATDGAVTFDELNGALQVYGDDANKDDFAFIAIHSAYVPSFLKMDGFVSAEVTHTADNNGIVVNNLLGYFRGIPVVITDRLYDAATQEFFILLIKKHALKFVPKEAVHVDAARDASTRSTTVFSSEYYATCLVDDAGIVLAKHTI